MYSIASRFNWLAVPIRRISTPESMETVKENKVKHSKPASQQADQTEMSLLFVGAA